ncbi:hypothetical protein RB531_2684 [Salmonella enterica subsp. enterica serovar Typhimurium]
MKNVFKTLAVLLTLFSLTGCGLKGPLYFPPADKNAPPPTKKSIRKRSPRCPIRTIAQREMARPRSITEDSFLSPRERSE